MKQQQQQQQTCVNLLATLEYIRSNVKEHLQNKEYKVYNITTVMEKKCIINEERNNNN